MSRIRIPSENGTVYVLEFDRKSAEIAERSLDISMAALTDGKLTYFRPLFQAALLKHHGKVKPAVVWELFDKVENKQELFQALVGMYAECVSTLVEEPEEGNGLSWEME